MIARLTGTLAAQAPTSLLLDVAGVGYEIAVPVSTLAALPEVGQEVVLHTHQHVREDALALFGFATPAEKTLFVQLIGVSGIGPKVALAILSVASVEATQSAIASGDTAFISSVPGIGKKTAERVIVDLRDKMAMSPTTSANSGHDEVMQALLGLGYSATEARRAVQKVPADLQDTSAALRHALKEIAA